MTRAEQAPFPQEVSVVGLEMVNKLTAENKQLKMDMRQKISTIMDAKRSQVPEIITNTEINEVYAFALGKEKHGAVKGFVMGVRLDDVPDALVKHLIMCQSHLPLCSKTLLTLMRFIDPSRLHQLQDTRPICV